MENIIRGVQDVIGYKFNDRELVSEAVSAAGSVAMAGSRRFPNGNKRLAIPGDIILKLALATDWYDGEEARDEFTRVLQQVGSNNNLSTVGFAKKLDVFVILPGAQKTVSPGLMATTVEAIIGAVYLDSNSMDQVKAVMRTLGLNP